MIKALMFDVFGTVVDWRGTIKSEGLRLLPHDDVDWDRVAVDWSKAYGRAVTKLSGWTNLDVLLASAFYRMAGEHVVDAHWSLLDSLSWSEQHEMATVWSRLKAWPDASEGFALFDPRLTLAAFSNANFAMQDGLKESSGLPWSVMLSAEAVKRYKPDPAIYRMAIDELDLEPEEIMLVAAHCFDLNAAARLGIRTALITREDEPGSDPKGLDHTPDHVSPDIAALARTLAG